MMVFVQLTLTFIVIFINYIMLVAALNNVNGNKSLLPKTIQSIPEEMFTDNRDSEMEDDLVEFEFFHINSKISYRYAITEIITKILQPSNGEKDIEFQIFIPETAFISQFRIHIDEITHEGKVVEVSEAQSEIEFGKLQGDTVGMVKMRHANSFNISLNIPESNKNGNVSISLVYEELIFRKYNYYEYPIIINPLTISYTKDFKINVDILESQEINFLKVPQLRKQLDVETLFEEANDDVQISKRKNRATLKWSAKREDQQEIIDDMTTRQFVVLYEIKHESSSGIGDLLVNSEGYFAHFFVPRLPPIRKHVLFVLDTSGSMIGPRMEQLREVLHTIINDLKPDDYFTIIVFDEEVEVWDFAGLPFIKSNKYPPFLSTENNLRTTHDEIDGRLWPPPKWTNIHLALITALGIVQNNSMSHVDSLMIFLTDGEPTIGITDREQILSDVKSHNTFTVPIFSIAFGTDTDYDFLAKLSKQNKGFSKQIYENGDASKQIYGFYKEISSALLTNLNINYTMSNNNILITDVTKANFSTAFSGTEIAVAGKINMDITNKNSTEKREIGQIDKMSVQVNGTGRYGQIDYRTNITISRNARQYLSDKFSVVERIWAFLTINQFLSRSLVSETDLDCDNTSMADSTEANIPSNLPENNSSPFSNETLENVAIKIANCGNITNTKELALHLALKYGFVTPVTTLIIVNGNGSYFEGSETKLVKAEPSADLPQDTKTIDRRTVFQKKRRRGGESGSEGKGRLRNRGYDFMQDLHMQNKEEKDPFENIYWIEKSDYNTTINGTIYLIPRSTKNMPVSRYRCENQDSTLSKVPGECKHLSDCVVQRLMSSEDDYEFYYFCPLKNEATGNIYAGVCCPDDF